MRLRLPHPRNYLVVDLDLPTIKGESMCDILHQELSSWVENNLTSYDRDGVLFFEKLFKNFTIEAVDDGRRLAQDDDHRYHGDRKAHV